MGVWSRGLMRGGLWIALLAVTIAIAAVITAQAQGVPFGAPRPAAGFVSQSGLVTWIFAQQAAFYRSLSGFIRASKDDGAAMWSLFGISLLYGIFHAVGPGHGKAVISSYLVANEETWRRGVILSFVSAFIQSVVAVIVVAVAAILFGATAKAIGLTVRVVEIVSYVLVILIGLRLLFVKGRSFLVAYRQLVRRRDRRDLALAVIVPIPSTARIVMGGMRVGSIVMMSPVTSIMRRPGLTRTARSHRNWPEGMAGAGACPR
jgi:nickel/cobalt exporter